MIKKIAYCLIFLISTGNMFSQEKKKPINLSDFENDAKKVFTVPPPQKFPLLKELRDPIFKTSIRRVTDSKAKTYTRHAYSELQAWNVDNTKLLMNRDIYDAKTFELLKDLPYIQGPKWCPVQPNILYYTESKSFKSMNIKTGKSTIIYTFNEKINREASFQELSLDGKRVVVVTYGPKGKPLVYSLDIVNKNILGSTQVRKVDWAGISPSGKYVVVNTGSSGSKTARGYGIEGYDATMKYQGKIWTGRPHCDIIMDKDGKEWFVGFTFDDYAFGFKPSVIKSRIPDGVDRYIKGEKSAMVRLLEIHWKHGGHISCRNIKNPTFCVVSAQGVNVNKPFVQETYLLDLNSTVDKPKVARVLHHQSSRIKCPVDKLKYWCEVHASANQDGTKIIYASNLMTSDCVNAFILDLSKGVKN